MNNIFSCGIGHNTTFLSSIPVYRHLILVLSYLGDMPTIIFNYQKFYRTIGWRLKKLFTFDRDINGLNLAMFFIIVEMDCYV